jgi:hypothetical protein
MYKMAMLHFMDVNVKLIASNTNDDPRKHKRDKHIIGKIMLEFMGEIRITISVIRSPHYPCLCVNSN